MYKSVGGLEAAQNPFWHKKQYKVLLVYTKKVAMRQFWVGWRRQPAVRMRFTVALLLAKHCWQPFGQAAPDFAARGIHLFPELPSSFLT